MAGYGVPEIDIATVIGIDPKTLRRHYRQELDTGHIKANSKVAENLFRKATGDGRESVVAAIFWLKTRARWKETMVNEVRVASADPLSQLLEQVAETGRRIHDPRGADAHADGSRADQTNGGHRDGIGRPPSALPARH